MRTLILTLMITLISPLVATAAPTCTFIFEKYPELCVEIQKSASFNEPASKDVAKSGGEIYFYFWKKNNPNGKTISIEDSYEITTELVMPSMLTGGVCYVKNLYELTWKTDNYGKVLVGKSLIQAGLYRIGVKIKKKGSQDKYSDISRLVAVASNDPVRSDPDFDEWVSRFTYQFSVPLKQ